MREDEYRRLYETCDALLAQGSLERTAVAWLHVLNEHPTNLALYSAVFERGKRPRLALRSAAMQLHGILARRRAAESDVLPRRADIVFVSHLLNDSQIGGEDFYFGPLPEIVRDAGLASCVLLRNASGPPQPGVRRQWPERLAPRYVVQDTGTVSEEISLRRAMARESGLLRALASAGDGFYGKVCTEAANNALSPGSLAALRFYRQIHSVACRLRPRAIVLTYEGHAWERLAFAAVRRAVPGAICIGYHHTILFPRQHAGLRPLGHEFDPDVVLTAGDIAADAFRSAFAAFPVTVQTLGIHRRQPREFGDPTGRAARCLVIPDGIQSEVVRLFDFALAAAKVAPEIDFVLRLHPVMSLSELQRRFLRYAALPANVHFSDDRIEADISGARWALYRGSNAAVYAVIAGVRPFYLEFEGELAIDSLHGLKVWKRYVREPHDFIAEARKDLAGQLDDGSAALRAAEYCRRYFVPLREQVLLDLVSA